MVNTVRVGRLKDKNNINAGIEFDATKVASYIPVVEVTFVGSNDIYAVVYSGFACDFSGERFVTHIQHYSLVSFMGVTKWTSVEDDNVDKSIFPNIRSMVADMELYLDTTTGAFHIKGDSVMYEDDLTKEVLQQDGTSYEPKKYEKKTEPMAKYQPYFKYLIESATGQAIITMITSDVVGRFNKLK